MALILPAASIGGFSGKRFSVLRRFQIVAAPGQIVGESAVPIVIRKVIQKERCQCLAAFFAEGIIAKIAVCDQTVIPVVHGQQKQNAVPVWAYAQIISVVQRLCRILHIPVGVVLVIFRSDGQRNIPQKASGPAAPASPIHSQSEGLPHR